MAKRTNTILIFSLTVFLISAIAYYCLYFAYKNLGTELSTLNAKSSDDKARLEQLQTIEDNLKVTLDDKDRLSALLIKSDGVVDFIQYLESTMKKLHLTGAIDSVAEEHPQELESTDKQKLNIALSAVGNWPSVVKFVGLIEKLPYKSAIDSFALTHSIGDVTDASGTKISTLTNWKVSLRMYALSEKEAVQNLNQDNNQGQAPATNTNEEN
jgi:hypothetical protein